MGLGLLGRGTGDAKFLAKYCKELIVTDLKTKEQLAGSIKKLRKIKNIKFVLGHHNLTNFKNTDMVIKGAGAPLDSPFMKEAVKNKIPVHMSTAIFAKFFMDQFNGKVVGITGTRGKTTTTSLIYHILKECGKNVFLGGNIQGISTLSMLEKSKPNSIAILELDSWQLQGFGYEKISPNVSVFTNFFPDHMNYYKNSMKKYLHDKANIFLWQTNNDHFILGEQIAPKIKKIFDKKIKSKITVAKAKDFDLLETNLLGEHNKANIACAVSAVSKLGISIKEAEKALKNFHSVEGRLELIKTKNAIKIYNDTTSTTPEAAIAGLKALNPNKNKKIILICGGADKNLDMSEFIKESKLRTEKIILLSGSGTDKIKKYFGIKKSFDSLKSATKEAFDSAKKEDIILFSPAFASFGMFKNEYDRGDKFNKIVKKYINKKHANI